MMGGVWVDGVMALGFRRIFVFGFFSFLADAG